MHSQCISCPPARPLTSKSLRWISLIEDLTLRAAELAVPVSTMFISLTPELPLNQFPLNDCPLVQSNFRLATPAVDSRTQASIARTPLLKRKAIFANNSKAVNHAPMQGSTTSATVSVTTSTNTYDSSCPPLQSHKQRRTR